MPYPGERCPQVAVYVVSQGLERGDIEDTASLGLLGNGFGEETVESPEKGGEGLARPGWGVYEGVFPFGDGRPAFGLSSGGRSKRSLEPGAGGGGE
jgi:hypothetical protein